MLVKTIMNAYQLQEEFRQCGRDYFSYDACEKLIALFNEWEEPQELDVIGICCDFTEQSKDGIRADYSNIEAIRDAQDTDELLNALNYYTYAIETKDGILYQNF